LVSCLAAREQTSAAQIAKASPPYNMKYFYSFLASSFNSIFNFFLTEAAQYECSYRRTAHQPLNTGAKVGLLTCDIVKLTRHKTVGCDAA